MACDRSERTDIELDKGGEGGLQRKECACMMMQRLRVQTLSAEAAEALSGLFEWSGVHGYAEASRCRSESCRGRAEA